MPFVMLKKFGRYEGKLVTKCLCGAKNSFIVSYSVFALEGSTVKQQYIQQLAPMVVIVSKIVCGLGPKSAKIYCPVKPY